VAAVAIQALKSRFVIAESRGLDVTNKLEPGDEWKASALQEPLEAAARESQWRDGLFVAIYHSMAPRPSSHESPPGSASWSDDVITQQQARGATRV
jgi:hypothetical protein